MSVTKDYIRKLLRTMGFKLEDGYSENWIKTYPEHNEYSVRVDFENETICYDDQDHSIKVHSKTTSNFSQSENFVVLECINRLLMKGYKPESIELEKTWPSGHGTSGRLDILVNKDEKPYLMIECKTHGKEFEKEMSNMQKAKGNGEPKGQLFAYGFQEKTTAYLCLYASRLKDDAIDYTNAIIRIEDEWKNLFNQKELYERWSKTYRFNGIFDSHIRPYNIRCKALLRKDLKRITDEDSSKIFNQFLEILRHNAVSDKPNAFNKILNLFICKIIDEDREEGDELFFQWKDDSDYISLQSNLEDLYKRGMEIFLDIHVTDYSNEEIERRLAVIDNQAKEEIKQIFQELRLQKNPEFAFKEVYNRESFKENAKVLKEVVQLLQPYQFRYGHKQQFLGNFFELLLNTSIKQESGQFFTPVPIAKFMISSLPIKETIHGNIQTNSKNILPLVIDYACGSGHFLTEYMDITQMIINDYETDHLKKSVRNTLEKWKQTDNEEDIQGEFEWAKDYVYGIEKDYRLVKTTKISTFLNGDGEANIIHADGLDKFSSDKYKGALSSKNADNENFDFVIANPPYSVSSFKETLSSDHRDFEIYDLITNNSSEIETLFVERTKQLLKEGGAAAIILPSPILTNNNQSTVKAREILLKHFYLKAIVKLGSNTFMATGTNTCILFLKKRPKKDGKIAQKLVDQYFETFKDFSFNSIDNMATKYIQASFENISHEDYVEYLKGRPGDQVEKSRYYHEMKDNYRNSKSYKELIRKSSFKKLTAAEQEEEVQADFKSYALAIEKDKMLYFTLVEGQETVVVKTGEKQAEKDFLGYDFSSSRGSEGIKYYNDEDGHIVSNLYSDTAFFTDETKLNYYIHSVMTDGEKAIPDALRNHVKKVETKDLMIFDSGAFDVSLRLEKKERLKFNCNALPLSALVTPTIGGTPSRKNRYYYTGENPWVSIGEMNGQVITDTKEKITDDAVMNSNVKLIPKGTTLISFKLSLGKVAIAGTDLYTNEAIAALQIKDKHLADISDEYLFYLFKSKVIDLKGDTKSFGNSLNSKKLGAIPIPFPPKEIQTEFIELCKTDMSRARAFFSVSRE